MCCPWHHQAMAGWGHTRGKGADGSLACMWGRRVVGYCGTPGLHPRHLPAWESLMTRCTSTPNPTWSADLISLHPPSPKPAPHCLPWCPEPSGEDKESPRPRKDLRLQALGAAGSEDRCPGRQGDPSPGADALTWGQAAGGLHSMSARVAPGLGERRRQGG